MLCVFPRRTPLISVNHTYIYITPDFLNLDKVYSIIYSLSTIKKIQRFSIAYRYYRYGRYSLPLLDTVLVSNRYSEIHSPPPFARQPHRKRTKQIAEKKTSDAESFERQKQARAQQQKIEKIEKQIARLEKEIKAIDFELEINYEQTIAQPNFFDEYQAKKRRLEDLMNRWEALQT